MKVLITGGSGSGKSLLAEEISVRLKKDVLYYFATMKIWDDECRSRVAKHRRQREGKGFTTVEVPENLAGCTEKTESSQTVLLECMSNLVANEQFEGAGSRTVTEIMKGIEYLFDKMDSVVIVTNEVFEDGMNYNDDMKKYIENLGEINCLIAEKSDIVIEVSAGNALIYKGSEIYNEISG